MTTTEEKEEINSQINSEQGFMYDYKDIICERFNKMIKIPYPIIKSMKMGVTNETKGSESETYCLSIVAEDVSDSYDCLRIRDILKNLPPGMNKYIGHYSVDIKYVDWDNE